MKIASNSSIVFSESQNFALAFAALSFSIAVFSILFLRILLSLLVNALKAFVFIELRALTVLP
jgi:hypothetical protein